MARQMPPDKLIEVRRGVPATSATDFSRRVDPPPWSPPQWLVYGTNVELPLVRWLAPLMVLGWSMRLLRLTPLDTTPGSTPPMKVPRGIRAPAYVIRLRPTADVALRRKDLLFLPSRSRPPPPPPASPAPLHLT
jgi:hypothetical protein